MFGKKKVDYNTLRLNLRISAKRLHVVQQKRAELALKAKRTIADLIRDAKFDNARMRVAPVILDDCFVEAMAIVEMLCERLMAQLRVIESTKSIDQSLEESIATIIWVSSRLKSDIPELKIVAQQLKAKYGKKYSDDCKQNGLGEVNKKVMDKLCAVEAPSSLIEKYLMAIADCYNYKFEPDAKLKEKVPLPVITKVDISEVGYVCREEEEGAVGSGVNGTVGGGEAGGAMWSGANRAVGGGVVVASGVPGTTGGGEAGGSLPAAKGKVSPPPPKLAATGKTADHRLPEKCGMAAGSSGDGSQVSREDAGGARGGTPPEKGGSLGPEAGRRGSLPEKSGAAAFVYPAPPPANTYSPKPAEYTLEDMTSPPPPYSPRRSPERPARRSLDPPRPPPSLPRAPPNANTLPRSAKGRAEEARSVQQEKPALSSTGGVGLPPRPMGRSPSPGDANQCPSGTMLPPRPRGRSPSRGDANQSPGGTMLPPRPMGRSPSPGDASQCPSGTMLPPRPRGRSPSPGDANQSPGGTMLPPRPSGSSLSPGDANQCPSGTMLPPRPKPRKSIDSPGSKGSNPSLGNGNQSPGDASLPPVPGRSSLSPGDDNQSPMLPPMPEGANASPGDANRRPLETSLSPGFANNSPQVSNTSVSLNEASPHLLPPLPKSRRSTESVNSEILLPGFPELPDFDEDAPKLECSVPSSPVCSTNTMDELERRFKELSEL